MLALCVYIPSFQGDKKIKCHQYELCGCLSTYINCESSCMIYLDHQRYSQRVCEPQRQNPLLTIANNLSLPAIDIRPLLSICPVFRITDSF